MLMTSSNAAVCGVSCTLPRGPAKNPGEEEQNSYWPTSRYESSKGNDGPARARPRKTVTRTSDHNHSGRGSTALVGVYSKHGLRRHQVRQSPSTM
ncbi:uncharacterized protein BJX67DRAFT_364583, partial [Aspergillus lucknowensis]